MPYIKDKEIRKHLTTPHQMDPAHCGELNYVLTKECHDYIKRKGLNYNTINEVIGVLECAKLEMYRMIAAGYEERKRIANGSVSDLDAKSLEDVR